MKIFQFNLLGILLFLAVMAVLIVIPSFVIQGIWNSLYAVNLERDMTIEVWQAALLWGAILSAIYMTGIFKFKIDFKTIDSIDLDSIDDPSLKKELEKLKAEALKAEEQEKDEDKLS